MISVVGTSLVAGLSILINFSTTTLIGKLSPGRGVGLTHGTKLPMLLKPQ